MTHKELNLVLQECPESPYFARDDFQTTENFARKLVLAFVERTNFDSHGPHIEAESAYESSYNKSLASISQSRES